jgi:hypothetical protein
MHNLIILPHLNPPLTKGRKFEERHLGKSEDYMAVMNPRIIHFYIPNLFLAMKAWPNDRPPSFGLNSCGV